MDYPTKFTPRNEFTGALLTTKPNSDAFQENLAIIQENNKKVSSKTCEECVTIPCVFPEKKEQGKKCSYFE